MKTYGGPEGARNESSPDYLLKKFIPGHFVSDRILWNLCENLFDIELTRAIAGAVSIPVIASGGAGKLEHFVEAVKEGHADAVLAASLFHFKELEIKEVKKYMRDNGIDVRL